VHSVANRVLVLNKPGRSGTGEIILTGRVKWWWWKQVLHTESI